MEDIRKNYEKLEEMRRQYEKQEMSAVQIQELKQCISDAKREKQTTRKQNQFGTRRMAAAVAAAAALFLLLPNTSEGIAYAMSSIPVVGNLVEAVTFRNYHHESERRNADINIPGVVTGDVSEVNENIRENLKKSTEQINKEIESITDQIIAEFKKDLEVQEGYQDVVVTHEILAAGEDYFTLKLICYQAAGSGAEQDYFYTIDLNTGKRIALGDLFYEGEDYISVISENIKEQMRKQMAEDQTVVYWLDDMDIPEWNFEKITETTPFYLDQEGELVICFNEGDVAPMSMGCVEFKIPKDVIASMRKHK